MTQSTTDTPTPTTDPSAQAEAWLDEFDRALSAGDSRAAAAMFTDDGLWRDLVSFTWNITTLEGHDQIGAMLEATLPRVQPKGWSLAEPATEAGGIVEAWINFETAEARGHGHLRLREGRAWTLLTTMVELKGYEEARGDRREKGVDHVIAKGGKTWLEAREESAAALGASEQPYVVVIGGGQGGIGLGARLKRMGVPTVILERNDRPGDSWRKRYKSLCLHDPVWYDHLPYLKFPDHWPVFAPKDKIGDWLEHYVAIMELDYWTRSDVKSATWDAEAQEWTVVVDRDGRDVTLRPKHLVVALGVSGYPHVPTYPGQDLFRGEQQHSSEHRGGEAYAGKNVVVIGSNNSAHDICASLWQVGARPTMVQRSSTHIVRSDSLMDLGLGDLYSERALAAGMTTEKADLVFSSLPFRIMPDVLKPAYDEMQVRDKDYYDALRKAGFELDFGVDGSGLFMKYLRRGSGYYIDVGASQLVIDGEVPVVHGQVDHLTEDAVVLADGTELPADVVIYATGYQSMNGFLEELISPEVADRVGKVWGFGSDTPKDPGPWEGELRNMWKPTAVDHLWIHGGNLAQSRHYSQFLGLQLKARYEGLDTPVYGLAEVHHRR
ncbi:MAG: NAD(P)/FAD-dependent oxidoreductase [Lapillicoccus sp.]